ncbi:hypothetical protein CW304_12425 [Bacillus sp. UFRGS-B20]|nr:hypothetical protein CW304_12425 [Bacillus sp. UFRGS-B20]
MPSTLFFFRVKYLFKLFPLWKVKSVFPHGSLIVSIFQTTIVNIIFLCHILKAIFSMDPNKYRIPSIAILLFLVTTYNLSVHNSQYRINSIKYLTVLYPLLLAPLFETQSPYHSSQTLSHVSVVLIVVEFELLHACKAYQPFL